MQVGAIVEARMTSSRLPGKVLMPVLGVPMLARLIQRLKQVEEIHKIVIATTDNIEDDEICNLAIKCGVHFTRGSETDVLGRVLKAAQDHDIDVIVEITGDCPVIDPKIVKEVILKHFESNADYTSNSNIRSYPDGMDVQVFSTETLLKSSELTTNELEREHVTLHIRNSQGLFKIENVYAPVAMNLPNLGLTLDTREDFEFLRVIIETLEPFNQFFDLSDTLTFLNMNPEILAINSHVTRKGDS